MIELHSPKPTQTSDERQPVTSKVSPWLTRLLYPLARFIVLPFYFGKITVTGQENLPAQGPVILAPTHRSRWDAILVTYATGKHVTGRHLRYMASANEFVGIKGWLMRRFGGFPIDTKRPGISSLRHGVELLQDGQMLVIFPEGGIFRDGQVHRLKPGLARLAIQAESIQSDLKVKIVPLVLRYDPTVPHWRSPVNICIGSPIEVSECDLDKPKESATQLTTDLHSVLQKLDNEFV